jgi:hypothetical protein
LALTSPTSSGHSVNIVHLWTTATEFSLIVTEFSHCTSKYFCRKIISIYTHVLELNNCSHTDLKAPTTATVDLSLINWSEDWIYKEVKSWIPQRNKDFKAQLMNPVFLLHRFLVL